MQSYTVIAAMGARFNAGSVFAELTADQVRRRAHALEPHTHIDGLHRVKAGHSVMFKRGERVTVDGEVNKALLELIVPTPEPGDELEPAALTDREADAITAAEELDVRASRAAEDLAEAEGVNLALLEGTGRAGAITIADVRAYIAARVDEAEAAAAEAAESDSAAAEGDPAGAAGAAGEASEDPPQADEADDQAEAEAAAEVADDEAQAGLAV